MIRLEAQVLTLMRGQAMSRAEREAGAAAAERHAAVKNLLEEDAIEDQRIARIVNDIVDVVHGAVSIAGKAGDFKEALAEPKELPDAGVAPPDPAPPPPSDLEDTSAAPPGPAGSAEGEEEGKPKWDGVTGQLEKAALSFLDPSGAGERAGEAARLANEASDARSSAAAAVSSARETVEEACASIRNRSRSRVLG